MYFNSDRHTGPQAHRNTHSSAWGWQVPLSGRGRTKRRSSSFEALPRRARGPPQRPQGPLPTGLRTVLDAPDTDQGLRSAMIWHSSPAPRHRALVGTALVVLQLLCKPARSADPLPRSCAGSRLLCRPSLRPIGTGPAAVRGLFRLPDGSAPACESRKDCRCRRRDSARIAGVHPGRGWAPAAGCSVWSQLGPSAEGGTGHACPTGSMLPALLLLFPRWSSKWQAVCRVLWHQRHDASASACNSSRRDAWPETTSVVQRPGGSGAYAGAPAGVFFFLKRNAMSAGAAAGPGVCC